MVIEQVVERVEYPVLHWRIEIFCDGRSVFQAKAASAVSAYDAADTAANLAAMDRGFGVRQVAKMNLFITYQKEISPHDPQKGAIK